MLVSFFGMLTNEQLSLHYFPHILMCSILKSRRGTVLCPGRRGKYVVMFTPVSISDILPGLHWLHEWRKHAFARLPVFALQPTSYVVASGLVVAVCGLVACADGKTSLHSPLHPAHLPHTHFSLHPWVVCVCVYLFLCLVFIVHYSHFFAMEHFLF